MIRSMTGFGTGEATVDGWQVNVTARSLNHRYRTVRVRTPADWPELQARVEDAVKRRLHRGDVNVWVAATRIETADGAASFDLEAARTSLQGLRRLSNELALPGEPTLRDLIALGAVKDTSGTVAPPWEAIATALEAALQGVVEAREGEGASLAVELGRIFDELERMLAEVVDRIPAVTDELRERLRERIDGLGVSVEPARLEGEIVLLADRYDVQEEVNRLEGHLQTARALLRGSDPSGRRLDFLAQELLREANTLGSKSRDLSIHSLVVDMKVSIDRLKEQAQNVE